MRCILIVTSLIWSTTCMAQAKGEGRLKPQTSFLWSLEGLALKSIATDEQIMLNICGKKEYNKKNTSVKI